jgi:hypothetical protein
VAFSENLNFKYLEVMTEVDRGKQLLLKDPVQK